MHLDLRFFRLKKRKKINSSCLLNNKCFLFNLHNKKYYIQFKAFNPTYPNYSYLSLKTTSSNRRLEKLNRTPYKQKSRNKKLFLNCI